MKPILIIDDYGAGEYDGFIDLDHWSDEGIVDFRKTLEQPEHLDVSQFAAVFIHASHPDLNWLIPKLKEVPSIQFTGGRISDSGLSGTTYHTTRSDFRDRVESIVNRYAETESIQTEDLQPPSKRRRQQIGNDRAHLEQSGDAPPYDAADVITFDVGLKAPDASTLTYPIVWDESGDVDFVETLRPLVSIDHPTPIYLEETYTDRVGGLELLVRIRLGDALGGSFSRFPVFVRLPSPESTFQEAEPDYMVALTETAQYGPAFPALEDVMDNAVLSPDDVQRFLDEVPIRSEPGTDHHDLSNAWGAFRLWRGHRLLEGLPTEWDKMPEELHLMRDRLLRRKFYMYLAAQSAISGSSTLSETKKDENNVLSSWRAQVNQHGTDDAPVRILLIEDEADKGWEAVVSKMLGVNELSVELEVCPRGGPFNFKDARETATDGSWDAVLCDLRLWSWKDPDRTASPDPSEKGEYSGVDLISKIKKETPFTPVIAFTSSNNVWTIEATKDAGVQHYWVKESPLTQRDDAYSRKSAGELLNAVISSVALRRQWLFLEELVHHLSSARKNRKYVETFAEISTEENVKDRLNAIERLLRRAYGFCFRQSSSFRREQLNHSDSDTRNHAFLQLWGCLNEILELRFDNPEGRKCWMLRSDQSAEVYWRQPRASGAADWVKDHLHPSEPSADPLSIAPFKPNAESGSDWKYIALLLREGGWGELVPPLDRCRVLRNSMDMIHGHTTNQAEPIQFDKHLRPLTSIISTLLYLGASE
jgi:CheY-like chemotaxis protein